MYGHHDDGFIFPTNLTILKDDDLEEVYFTTKCRFERTLDVRGQKVFNFSMRTHLKRKDQFEKVEKEISRRRVIKELQHAVSVYEKLMKDMAKQVAEALLVELN